RVSVIGFVFCTVFPRVYVAYYGFAARLDLNGSDGDALWTSATSSISQFQETTDRLGPFYAITKINIPGLTLMSCRGARETPHGGGSNRKQHPVLYRHFSSQAQRTNAWRRPSFF